jgi:molybdate transport system substrate-binding protein
MPLAEVGKVFQQQVPQVELVYNFASSGSLQRQIEQGAPVDVFISAAPRHMDALAAKGLLLADSRQDLLTNQVVLVTQADGQANGEAIFEFEALTDDRVQTITIGDPDSVPAGQYAKQVLDSLGLYDSLQGANKLVFAKDVRQVLTYVETGNVEAGLVYATDAALSPQVKVVAMAPVGSHQPIVYPVAALHHQFPAGNSSTVYCLFG